MAQFLFFFLIPSNQIAMKNTKATVLFDQLGTAIGVGLLAGLAGTLAITLSQTIEMKLSGRQPSTIPADAVSQTLDIQPVNEASKSRLANQVHWAYGTCWGVARGLLSLAGLKGWPATLAHFVAVWGTSMIMLPALKLSPAVNEREPQELAVDGLHHAVYAAAAGLAFNAIEE